MASERSFKGGMRVYLYEMFGTMLFLYLLLIAPQALGSSPKAPLSLFVAIVMTAGISGGAINPAVTMGLYFAQPTSKYISTLLPLLCTLASQFVGAFLGYGLAMLVSSTTNNPFKPGSTSFLPIINRQLLSPDPESTPDFVF